MRTPRYRRWAVVVLLVGWAFAWTLLWQTYLFDLLDTEPGAGVVVFADRSGDVRRLLIAVGAGFGIGVVGVLFLVVSGAFRHELSRWSRIWQVTGLLLIAVGLSLPVLFPSARNIVVDAEAGFVAIEERWLYAREAEPLPFDQIERVWLSDQRTSIGRRDSPACLVKTELSFIRSDRTWLDVPGGFPLKEIASHVAETAGATIDLRGTREC